PGRGVRLAAFAGAKALRLRRRGGAEEPDVAPPRESRRAARTAVDARGAHADVEEAVVAWITASHEAVAALEILDHAGNRGSSGGGNLAIFGHVRFPLIVGVALSSMRHHVIDSPIGRLLL